MKVKAITLETDGKTIDVRDHKTAKLETQKTIIAKTTKEDAVINIVKEDDNNNLIQNSSIRNDVSTISDEREKSEEKEKTLEDRGNESII